VRGGRIWKYLVYGEICGWERYYYSHIFPYHPTVRQWLDFIRYSSAYNIALFSKMFFRQFGRIKHSSYRVSWLSLHAVQGALQSRRQHIHCSPSCDRRLQLVHEVFKKQEPERSSHENPWRTIHRFGPLYSKTQGSKRYQTKRRSQGGKHIIRDGSGNGPPYCTRNAHCWMPDWIL